jgi:hypothetical protein
LLFTDGIPPFRKKVLFPVDPEGRNEIKNHRRSHGKKGNVNKVPTDYPGRDAQSLPYPGTYTKELPFHKILESIHPDKNTTI